MKKIFLISLLLLLGSWATSPMAAVFVSINIAPPMLPIYAQPPAPADDFLWIPGYWAYNDDDDYFWVPGTWMLAPRRGYLWTPGYWAWNDGLYYWNGGYWGPTVGYYGGVYYGYGYDGSGYYGGRWNGDHFYYNRSVNNVSVTTIHNTYNETINRHVTVNRVSYNGGQGGTTVRPDRHERDDAQAARHLEPTAEQTQHEHGARGNRELRASVNKGTPPIAATPRPGAFTDRNARPARSDASGRPARARGNEATPRTERPARSRPETAPPMHEPREHGRQQPRELASPQGEPGRAAPRGSRGDAEPQESEPRQRGKKEKRQQTQDQDRPSEEAGPQADGKR